MKTKLSISIGQCSNKGIKDRNEDFYGVSSAVETQLENKGIACAIADGMGSCAQAAEASEQCVKSFLGDYFSTPETWSVKTSGAKVLTAINNWLLSQSNSEHAHGMVTTFSALILKSTSAHIFHIGDSRIYRYRAANENRKKAELELLTNDHRIWISEGKNYLSRAMGIDLHLDIDYKAIAVEQGDIFVMTTDGIHDYIADAELKELLTSDASLEVISDNIVTDALLKKSHDNVTCQLIRIDQLPTQDANEVYNELTKLPFPPHLGPGMTIDGYEVLDEIHASTTSQLYKVRDKESGEHFIMKTPSVNFEDDPAYIERFYIEEWAGKRINSDSVLKIHEQQRQRNFLYFIMEYIEGKTLRQWMNENPSPEIQQAIELAQKIITGLRVFHRLEMIHRDLKPENIMLTKDGDVKIIDFGSVKIAGIHEISTPVERLELLGTKNYTAPEYLLSMDGNNQSDIFSLGIIIYEMLTGHLPYEDKLSRKLNWRTLNKIPYTSSIEHNPMIPLWLDGALEKAVRTDLRTRYDSFSELLYDLTHPNKTLIKIQSPLIDRSPVLFWKVIAGVLFVTHLFWLWVYLGE